jgi:multicomponent Na+:H+ antiporter subunit G
LTIEWAGIALMATGVLFIASGTMGVVRYRNVYLRIHAMSQTSTFGVAFFLLGTGLLEGDANALARCALASLFILMTGPLSGQMLARAALRRGIEPEH